MRTSVIVLACLAFAANGLGTQHPKFHQEGELVNAKALAALLHASNPESAFSMAGGRLRSPRGTLNRASSVNMVETWKEYLTKSASKLKELEAAKTARDAEPPLPPIESLGLFEMKNPADGMAAVEAQMAKADATQVTVDEKSKELAEYFAGIKEEITKLESILGDDVSFDGKKQGTDEFAANKASEQRLIARLQESISQSGKTLIPESLFASFKLDVAAIGKELSRSYRGYGVE